MGHSGQGGCNERRGKAENSVNVVQREGIPFKRVEASFAVGHSKGSR